MVTFPTTFSDPGYQGCYAPYLMGWHGGLPIKGIELNDLFQLLRGTFIIHTRAYNAKKPMHPTSNFARLYKHFHEGAAQNLTEAVPAMPLGRRTPAEEVAFAASWEARQMTASMVNKLNSVEPPWFPAKPRMRLKFESEAIVGWGKKLPACLAVAKKSENILSRRAVSHKAQRLHSSWV